MKQYIQRLSVTGLFIGLLTFGGVASAHVVVKPAEVVTAGFQTFTVSVPNEKDMPTTSLKLNIPVGMKHVSPTTKTGWNIDVAKEGETSVIAWSGGTIENGFRDDFTFSGQVPDQATELQWKAYQTYADGTTVAWDKATSGHSHDSEDKNTGPFSVTQVVPESAVVTSAKQTEQAAADAKTLAQRALYIGVAGVVIGLGGVYMAIRKK